LGAQREIFSFRLRQASLLHAAEKHAIFKIIQAGNCVFNSRLNIKPDDSMAGNSGILM
jgi:hypothetical protein